MGKKKKKNKVQVFVNKYYMPLLLLFVFGILLTAAIIDKNKTYEANNSTLDPIIVEQGWSYNEKTDTSIKIYGKDVLSTEPSTDDVYHEYYCQTDECLFIHGNDNFALIDDGKYMIFSLIDEAVFDIPKLYDLDESEFVVNNNVLYGLIFNEDDHEIYYSLDYEKYFFENNDYYVDRSSDIIVKDKKILVYNSNGYYLYDLDSNSNIVTGNTIYINYLDGVNDYFYKVNDNTNRIKNIYTSDLYVIETDGAVNVLMNNNNFVYTADNKTFIVKNKENEIISVSSAYDEIYEFYDNYIIAKRDDNLLILDQSDEVIKEIPLDGYKYDSYRSGYYKDTLKEGFHLFLDNNIDMYEVYFNPSTLEYYKVKY